MARLLVCGALAGLAGAAVQQDGVSLLQHSVSAGEGPDFERVMAESETQMHLKMAPQYSQMMSAITPHSSLTNMVQTGKELGQRSRKALERGWKSFFEKARHSRNPKPQELLQHAKLALLETGAMQEMRHMARVSSNASRAMTQGAVPLDSMIIGFRTSVAPWNNVLKMFSIPLIKASFRLFSNFFGPDGNAARLCVGAAVAADSTYGVHTHAEFGGINIFIGPAKWDNVPGWNFGTSGGVDNVRILDVADFGWVWTLSREPETVCFHYDICVIDDEALHSNLLQTGSQVEQESSKAATIPRHGSTWVEHIWCSPDWENTPLVLPDDTSGSTMQEETEKDGSGKPYFKAEEEWDPESEAV